MRKIGMFIDLANVYISVKQKYKRKVDYKKYWDFVADLGTISYAIAYGTQVRNAAKDFRSMLQRFGYETKYKDPGSWAVGMTVDAMKYSDIDMLVLGSNDKDFLPLLEFYSNSGKTVLILASQIPDTLKAYQAIEIPESLLEIKT